VDVFGTDHAPIRRDVYRGARELACAGGGLAAEATCAACGGTRAVQFAGAALPRVDAPRAGVARDTRFAASYPFATPAGRAFADEVYGSYVSLGLSAVNSTEVTFAVGGGDRACVSLRPAPTVGVALTWLRGEPLSPGATALLAPGLFRKADLDATVEARPEPTARARPRPPAPRASCTAARGTTPPPRRPGA
jgi:hypothetical protein